MLRLTVFLFMTLMLLFTLVLEPVSAGTPPRGKFEFIQDGKVIAPVDGVIRLKRAPFEIRYTGRKMVPSIVATTNPKALEQVQSFTKPVVTYALTGAAASPNKLLVLDEAFEFYDGWRNDFERDHGSSLHEYAKAYRVLRDRLGFIPIILTSGRFYVYFEKLHTGIHLARIESQERIEADFDFSPRLFVFLFEEKESQEKFFELKISQVTLEFVE